MNHASKTKLQFHHGNTLKHLADRYPTLLDVILETVQNALDVEANEISIVINFQTRNIVISDNGNGVSVADFNTALSSVAQTRKDKGSLGQFGIGLISPLGKCQRFVFISCPSPHKVGFQEWTFVSKDIINTERDVNIPIKSRLELNLEKGRGVFMECRTQMSLYNFVDDDAYVSRIEMDALVCAIIDRFSSAMRKRSTKIAVSITRKDGTREFRKNVQAPKFNGQKLPEETIDSGDAGKVLFKLFVAPKPKTGQRVGRVVMGTNRDDFRFPFHLFLRSAHDLLSEEVSTALSSGIFEGEIIPGKAELVVERDAYLKKGEFLIDLCIAIEQWFNSFGKKYIEEVKEARKEQRYQDLGIRSLKVLANLLKNSPLLSIIKSFKLGSVGEGHSEPKKKNVVGKQEEKSLSIEGGAGQKREGKAPELDKKSEEHNPEKEKQGTIHYSATGPKGRVRRVVSHSSVGLQFCYDDPDLLGSSDLWHLDAEKGVLSFNVRHPLWDECAKTDTALMKFQELVAIRALTLQMMPEATRFCQRQFSDELIAAEVSWLMEGDKMRRKASDSLRRSKPK